MEKCFGKLGTGHYQYVWSSQAALCQFWLIFLLSLDPKSKFEQTHLDLVRQWDSQRHKYGLEARGEGDNVDCLQIQLYLLHISHLQVLQTEFCFLPFIDSLAVEWAQQTSTFLLQFDPWPSSVWKFQHLQDLGFYLSNYFGTEKSS